MDKTQLIQEIERKIYPNNNGEITGQKLQDILKRIVEFAVETANEQAGRKGEDGVGISNISMVSGEGLTNRSLKITLTNNETFAYPIFDGKDGVAGVQGPKGANGKDGKDGINGIDGRNGVDGRDGIDGKDGKDGKDGYEGRDGRDGKDGQDGRDGRDGRDGQDGRDGEDGKDGKDGRDGKQGRTGAAVRGPYDYYAVSAQTRWWCSGEEMEETPENAKWIDIVAKDQKYYACRIGYYGRLSPWEDVVEDHWMEGESFEFVATKLLLAKNASIDFLTGNEIYLRDRFGNITAGAAGGNGVSFWAGAEDPSDGPFKVYYDGRLVATDAQIKGAITANSLTLGDDTSIEDYIGDKISDYAENSGINYTQVNEAISTFLHDNDYIQGQVLTGYVTGDLFETWIQQWNASHSGQTLTDAEIEEMANRIVGSEISNVISLTRNPDGSITHTMNIGGREYTWVTYDIGDYVLLGAMFSGETESGVSKFIVSKQGLLQANNAIIYGKIYASEGYFHGSVSATDGYFRGSVSADNGYFKGRVEANEGYFNGDITANSLTLGSSALNTVKDIVTENAVDSATVKSYLTNFIETQLGDITSALTGYVDRDSFDAWVANWNAAHSGQTLTDEEIEALADRIVGAEISNVINLSQNEDGSITHTINIGGREYSWVTYDIGDYVLLGAVFSGMSGNELTKFVVSKNGLLQANNAIIYGKIYASEGYFHGSVSATDGYFKGSISADGGYFKGRVEANEGFFTNMSATNITMDNSFFSGNVYANSLTLGNNQPIEEYIVSKINGYAASSGMNYEQVNQAIRDFLNEGQYVGSSALTGYITSGLFESWVAQWNASHSGQTLTDEEIEALAERIVGAEISNVIGLTRNPDGSITHTMNIGGNEYNWVTYDAGDYMLLGAVFSGMSGNELTKFIVSKDGLLQANNAIIYGKIYASEGYFHGSVSATDGCFKGSVSADNGYFKGDIVARSLKLGDDQTIEQYVDGKIASAATSGLDTDTVNQLINDYLTASGITMDGYMTESAWTEWVNNWNATHPDSQIDEGVVSAIVRSELSKVFSETTSGGVTTHTALIGDRTYSWKTVDTGDYLLVDTGLGELDSASTGGFIISKDGLLQAYNALIYGKIYASEGYFKGSVSADNGYFHGDIVANSLRLGDQTIQDYVSGKVSAATGNEGLTTQDVNELISGAARDYQWVVLNDLGDYLVVGTPLGPNSALTISKNGLLVANNAIVSGTVFATDGIFNGTIYADNSKFRGSVSATDGYFKGSISATNGYFKGDIVARSLKLGTDDGETLQDYVDGKITDAVAGGIDAETVNQLINNYLTESGITMDGYMSESAFTAWVDEWNASHPDNPIDEAAASAISKAVFDAEISKVFSSTSSGGVTTHTAVIGDRTYTWKTVDTGEYLLIDTGLGELDSASTGGFIVSRDGLVEAYNAVIYGKIYASEGYFKGSISADNGYFKGSVSAENGYFNGKIEAKEGRIGNIDITPEGLSGTNINITNNYMFGDNVAFKGSISATNGYFSGNVYANDGVFRGDVYANNGEFNGAITATSLTLVDGAQVDVTPEAIGIDTSQFIKLDSGITGNRGEVLISRSGLLQAKNAIISGSVYATNGYFKGDVHADSGEFRGEITASAGTIGGIRITEAGLSGKNINITNNYFFSDNVAIKGSISAENGYFKGDITANSLTLGTDAEDDISDLITTSTSGIARDVKMLSGGCVVFVEDFGDKIDSISGVVSTSEYKLNSLSATVDSWGITDMGDYMKLDHTVASGDTSVYVSKRGLLQAKNAIVSGTVWATDGVFNGAVYADRGRFTGDITANSLTLATNASVSGKVYATKGVFENVSGNNIVMKNAIVSGSVHANSGYFKGNVEADSGYFKGNITANSLTLGNSAYVSGTVYATTGKIEKVTASTITATTFSATNSYFKGKIDADSGYFKGDITANSLTLASNASVSGTVYATNGKFENLTGKNLTMSNSFFSGNVYAANGYFNGDVTANSLTLGSNANVSGTVYATSGKFNNVTATKFSATSSYFKGKIAADSGYFNGDITANSLTLANNAYVSGTVYATNGKFENLTGKNLTMNNSFFSGNVYGNNAIIYGKVYADSGYFKGDITANSLTLASNASVSGTVYATNGKFNNVTATQFSATNSYFKGKIAADDGYFKGNITANSLTLGGVEYNEMPAGGVDSATVNTLINTAAANKGWLTTGSGVYIVGNPVGGGASSFTVSTGGLLTAKNAIISGSVYATRGVFNGDVYADNGRFNGAITASSLSLGSTAAASVSGAINLDKFYKLGNTVGGSNSSVTISTGGLLTAKNAVISGSVYATNGVFNGKVYATGGEFSGAVKATSLQLGSTVVTSIPDTSGFLELGENYDNLTIETDGLLTAKNAFISGSVYATNGLFKGTVCAETGCFKGKIEANEGVFAGYLRFPYINMTTLPHTGTTYSPGTNAYIVAYPEIYGGSKTLKLPAPSESLNGFTYDVIVQPGLSRMDAGSSVIITAQDDSYIYCYAFSELRIDTQYELFGGRCTITCAPYDGYSYKWIITQATAGLCVGNTEYLSTLVGSSTDQSRALTKIVTYTGSTHPSQYASSSDSTLFIKTDS